jgi:branched-chain amino acid transport system ATP-binding protein
MAGSAILEVTRVHTYYGESHVLQGVSFEAATGTVTAILGRNGAGKTTLCRSLTGLTPARSGAIVFGGSDVTRLAPHRIVAAGISLVPQGRRTFTSLTVREHLAIAARPGSRAPQWNEERVFALFPRLSERQSNLGHELSGGEQQMLAIARALIANPALLIMDEPTEGLAPAVVEQVAGLIRRLREEGTSVLLIEQNAAFAVGVADHIYVMSQGTIVHSSAPDVLWANESIKTRLLGVPGAQTVGPPRGGAARTE